MAAQWDDEQKLEEILEQKWMDGSLGSLRLCEEYLSWWCMNASQRKEESIRMVHG